MTNFAKLLTCLSFVFQFLIPVQRTGATQTLPQGELCVNNLFTRLGVCRDDQDKKRMADTLTQLMGEVLTIPGSFEYPFDMLKKMGRIRSADGKIRIYTWNLPWNDGTNSYFGFLQYKTGNKKETRLVTLTDRHSEITNPGESTLTADRWYGMLVYEIVEKEYNNKVYYTLLGYHSENLFLSCKITDVLYFNDIHEPVFGKALFHYHDQFLCRILFEYSAKVQMSLKWNVNLKMIVFDHLAPSNPSNAGNYEYYGPDLSFDGLKFENGTWELVENVDVRNIPKK
jgi:hypothetical protein